MSDQIILEFIGDPSGLRPAEEALKGLSKISQDTVESFNKANDAAKKFAAGAKEASTSIKSIGDASDKTIRSISTLTSAISAGAIRAIITDFKAWATEISALTEKNNALKDKLSTIEANIRTAAAIVEQSARAYNTASREALSYEEKLTKVAKAMTYYTAEANAAAANINNFETKLAAVKKELEAMNGTSDEGGKKYKQLAAEAANLQSQIEKSSTAYVDSKMKVMELGDEHKDLEAKLGAAQQEMIKYGAVMQSTEVIAAELGKEKKQLTGEIAETTKAIEDSSKEFSDNSKAAKESTQSLSSLLSNSKKLVTSLGEVSAAFADATGNERDANAIRRKTTEILNDISKAQAVVTATTEGLAAATEFATGAALALEAAIWPITIVLAVVAAAAGAVYAGFKLFERIEGVVKPVGDLVKWIGTEVTELKEKMRDMLSLLTFGLVENSALHKHNEEIKKAGEGYQKNSEALKRQIDMLEAEGASAEKIAAKKKEQLEYERGALKAQLELEGDLEKKKEIRNKLDENAVSIAQNTVALGETHLDTMREQGASELQIAIEKKHQNEEAIAANAAELLRLKTIMQIGILQGGITDEMIHQVVVLEDQAEVLAAQHKQLSANVAKERKAANEKALQDRKELADAELAAATAGSHTEYEAKIKDLDAAAAYEAAKAKGNSHLLKAIDDKLAKDKAEIKNTYLIKTLEDEKIAIEAAMINAKNSATDDAEGKAKLEQTLFDLKQKLIAKEVEIIESNTKLTADQKTIAIEQIYQRERDAHDKALKENEAKEKEALKVKLTNAQIEFDKKQTFIKESYESTQTALKDQLAAENNSFKQKEEILNQYYNSVDAELQKEKEALTAKYNSDKQLAEKNAEQLKIIEDKHVADEKEMNKKIADNDKEKNKKIEDNAKESAKKQEEIAKQIGAKLIEMAKEISDAIFDNEKQKRDNDLQAHLDTLNARKDAELSNTSLTNAQKKAIEAKYKREEAAEKLKAWKEDQKAKAEQAIINGLLAFTSSMAQQGYPAGLITGLLAIASAGVQAGIIMSKTPPKFAKGVVALEGPGTETSDSISAYLSKGESVITAKATKQYAPLLEAMNAGTFSEYMPIPQMPDVTGHIEAARTHSRTVIEKLDYEKLGEAFAKKVNLKQLNITIDEKGFTKSILSKGSRVESYNDRLKF